MKFDGRYLALRFGWPQWLMPRRLLADLKRRSTLTGTAGKGWRFGPFDLSVSAKREP